LKQAEAENRRMALIAGVVIAGLIAITFPFAGRPLPHLAAFLPMFAVFAVGVDSLTAYLLMTHERVVNYPPLAVLAAAFVYSGLIAALQVLTFPTAFTATGLFDVNGQTAVWMWVFWHLGFPLGVVVYADVDARWKRSNRLGFGVRPPWMRLAIPGAAALALLTLPAAVFVAGRVTLVDHGNFAPGFASGVFPLVIAVNVVALAIGAVRFWRGTVIQVWMLVALFTMTCDVTLNLIGAHSRFTVGWYGSRLCTLLSTSTLLGVLIGEIHTMYARAAALAGVDGLTGIGNRRSHEDRLEVTYRMALRTGRPFALIMFDVDWFKAYNDAFGHLAGDDALREVAGAARASLGRSSDAVARYGGEEFVVVLGETNAAGARVVGERIRAAVADLHLPHAPATGVPYLSVSVGCAAFEAPTSETPSELRERADRALYAAKDAGRNRVEVDQMAVAVS
jgi:diguanylate cyclase (GGDEF)-like protein